MKVRVADRLEKYDLTVVRRVWFGLKPTDGGFQLLNIRCHPRVTEKLVSCRDPQR
jgi:hypothetical protein